MPSGTQPIRCIFSPASDPVCGPVIGPPRRVKPLPPHCEANHLFLQFRRHLAATAPPRGFLRHFNQASVRLLVVFRSVNRNCDQTSIQIRALSRKATQNACIMASEVRPKCHQERISFEQIPCRQRGNVCRVSLPPRCFLSMYENRPIAPLTHFQSRPVLAEVTAAPALWREMDNYGRVWLLTNSCNKVLRNRHKTALSNSK